MAGNWPRTPPPRGPRSSPPDVREGRATAGTGTGTATGTGMVTRTGMVTATGTGTGIATTRAEASGPAGQIDARRGHGRLVVVARPLSLPRLSGAAQRRDTAARRWFSAGRRSAQSLHLAGSRRLLSTPVGQHDLRRDPLGHTHLEGEVFGRARPFDLDTPVR